MYLFWCLEYVNNSQECKGKILLIENGQKTQKDVLLKMYS